MSLHCALKKEECSDAQAQAAITAVRQPATSTNTLTAQVRADVVPVRETLTHSSWWLHTALASITICSGRYNTAS
jgi:hypothetical protein